jgi:hypothetical protein
MAINPGPSLTNVSGQNIYAVINATIPPEGPKAIPQTLDFISANTVLVDFTLAFSQGRITAIQTLWLDNSANDQPVQITVEGTQQIITFPAGAQGTIPIIAANRPKFTCVTNGDVALQSVWLNVPMPQALWFPAQGAGTVAAAAASTSIAAGGTAQTVWTAGAVPNGGAVVLNPLGASESLFVDIVQPATDVSPAVNGTTVELPAGSDFIIPPGFQGAVYVNAVTTGHKFVAYGVGTVAV